QEGLNAAETIQVSQELDKLIVKYQNLVMQGRE
ncbi:Spo0E family sporulation regulatory protein-aspartic acid phosphatase, partial [Bacillus thuringiensis]|nr:Spo0E family sporulation regulatory protein-aspartic acid phosphatase [Bacillus thuringiensis]